MLIKPTLLCDSRERIPWSFEDDDDFDSVKYCKLNYGDYSIAGLEKIIAIERKASADEVLTNFTADKDRFLRAMANFSNIKHRFIVIEETSESLYNPMAYFVNNKKHAYKNPKAVVAIVLSNLTTLMLENDIHVIFAGKNGQSITKGLLLKAWSMHSKSPK